MKAIHIATLAVLAAVSTATMASTNQRALTRAEVKAELARAIATHTMPVDAEQRTPSVHQPSTVSRAEVIADLQRALATGTMPVNEEQRAQYVNRPSTLTRAAVIADLRRALATGTMPVDEEQRSALAQRGVASAMAGAPDQCAPIVGGLSRGEKNTL